MRQLRDEPEKIIDPTANVLALVSAAMTRQDDLRIAEIRRQDDLNRMRDEYETKLRSAEARRIDAVAAAEARRLDALLAAQNNAVALANTRAELTAAALAERVDTAAKTLAAEAGSKEQRSEGRTQTNVTFQQILTIVAIGLGALYFILQNTP